MPVNRTRMLIWKHQTTLYLDGYTFADALTHITNLRAVYGNSAQIREYTEDYSDRQYLGIYVETLETDEEMAARIKQEEERDARREEQDRQDYQRLLKKFKDTGK